MACASVVIQSREKVLKDLVTNLTDNELLVNAAVFASGDQICAKPTYISKSQDPDGNWRFVYEFNPGCNIVEFGAAGLTSFIAKNFKLIAALFLAVLGFTLIWRWETHLEHQTEAEVKLSDNIESEIDKILSDDSLTPEQKHNLIEKILGQASQPQDWTQYILPAAGLFAGAIVLSSLLGKR